MTLIDQIKQDREAGTDGPWLNDDLLVYSLRPCKSWIGADSWENSWQAHITRDGQRKTPLSEVKANARRIARVPDMENALLAAEELAGFLESKSCCDIWDQELLERLTAFRKALEADK